jgi:hypothetical protein
LAVAPRPGSLEWVEQRIAEEQARQVRRADHTALTAAAAARLLGRTSMVLRLASCGPTALLAVGE